MEREDTDIKDHDFTSEECDSIQILNELKNIELIDYFIKAGVLPNIILKEDEKTKCKIV